MKKLILLLAIAGFFVQSYAQKLTVKEVPTAVTTAFYKTYPSIQDISWSKDGLFFEAEYTTENVVRSATYDVTGKLINTRQQIVATALPAPAMDYVKINYKEEQLNEVSKITDASNVVTYEAEVKGMELTFDSKGKFINSVKEE